MIYQIFLLCIYQHQNLLLSSVTCNENNEVFHFNKHIKNCIKIESVCPSFNNKILFKN